MSLEEELGSIAELIGSIGQDINSPIPGFFTGAWLLRRLEFKYPGKGKGGKFSTHQMGAIKRWLNENCEKRRFNGKIFYRPRF